MPMGIVLSLITGLAAYEPTGELAPEPIDAGTLITREGDERVWVDALTLGLEGQGFTNLAHPYDRLPADAEGVVRDVVWTLGHDSAGLALRFWTDATAISARWTLRSEDLQMHHMPATGVSGVDLYGRGEDTWHWMGVGRPTGVENESILAEGIEPGGREYLVYLPLYNGTNTVLIGVPAGSRILRLRQPPGGPVVFYGTSITQGGCASRPGMAYPAILGRRLGVPAVNLGFSGNGQMEPEVIERIARIDASAFVLDCLPNMDPDMVIERVPAAVRVLRATHPGTPIILVESIRYQQSPLLPHWAGIAPAINAALRKAYEGLVAEEISGLWYVEGDGLLGDDGEATVDGVHPTDLGFLRMVDVLAPVLTEALGLGR